MNLEFFKDVQSKLFSIGDSVKIIHVEQTPYGPVEFVKLGKIEAVDECSNFFIKIREFLSGDGETCIRFSAADLIQMLEDKKVEKA